MVGIVALACGTGLLGFWLYFAGRTRLQRWHQADSLAVGNPELQRVRVLRGDVEIALPIHALQVGDTIMVHSGEVIPVAGVITAGAAWVETHHVQGDSCKEVKKVHHRVCANQLVLAGWIFVQVELSTKERTQ